MSQTVPRSSFNLTSETSTTTVAGIASIIIKASVYTPFVPAITTTTISTTAAATPVILQDAPITEISLLKKSIIISSVLGGVTILLIILLATAYCIYKQRHNGGFDSPPLTSLAPPPSGILSPRTNITRPQELYETPLPMSRQRGFGTYRASSVTRPPISSLPPVQRSPSQQPQLSKEILQRSLPQLPMQHNSPGLFNGRGADSSTDETWKQQAHRWQDVMQARSKDGAQTWITGPGRGVMGLKTVLELQTRPRGAGEVAEGFEMPTPALRNLPSSGVGPRALSLTSSISAGSDIAGLGILTLADGQGSTRNGDTGTGNDQGMLYSTRASSGVFPDE
jgi:hypothetical protein